MSDAYNKDMINKGKEIAEKLGFRCFTGIYVSVPGPCLETPAEYMYLHSIGANAVGMSTVPEIIVARHMGLACFAISIITDVGYPPERIKKVTIDEIIAAANIAEPKMTQVLKELI